MTDYNIYGVNQLNGKGSDIGKSIHWFAYISVSIL